MVAWRISPMIAVSGSSSAHHVEIVVPSADRLVVRILTVFVPFVINFDFVFIILYYNLIALSN